MTILIGEVGREMTLLGLSPHLELLEKLCIGHQSKSPKT